MTKRPARLRKKGVRKLVRETSLLPSDLICPLFVDENAQKPIAIPSLPGFYRHTVETAVSEAEAITELGVPAIIVFGLPCLLYTSDAADDLLCVDLGGRRIIKK